MAGRVTLGCASCSIAAGAGTIRALMRHAVILAGGSGTRLWPASRRAHPKQLLALTAANEPLVATAARLGASVCGRALIVTADSQAAATRDVVPGVEILAEPVGRNTAAAIGLAAAMLAARDPDAVALVLPADQHVTDKRRSRARSSAGARRRGDDRRDRDDRHHADARRDRLWLPRGRGSRGAGRGDAGDSVRREARSRRPPSSYVASGRYLWNAGIFCATREAAARGARRPACRRPAHAVREIAREPSIGAQRVSDAAVDLVRPCA